MHVHAAREIARKMRGLARRANNFGYSREQILEEVVNIAENYEEVAERIEMDLIEKIQQASEDIS